MTLTPKLLVDWNNDGDFTDTYDNIWSDVVHISIRFGMRNAWQNVADEIEIDIIVDNTDGKYNPENSGGVLYGSLLPGRKLKFLWDVSGTEYLHFLGWIETINTEWQVAGPYTGKTFAFIKGVGIQQRMEQTPVNFPLRTALRGDEIISRIVHRVQPPPADIGAYWQIGTNSVLGTSTVLADKTVYGDISEGVLTYDYFGDLSDDQIERMTMMGLAREVTEAERGYFLQQPNGKILWAGRYYLDDISEATATIKEDGTGDQKPITLSYNYGGSLLNRLEVRGFPRKEQSTRATLWSLSASKTVPQGFSEAFDVELKLEGNAVSARLLKIENETGTDTGHKLSVTGQGSYAQITIDNRAGTTDAVITAFDVTGVPITQRNTVQVEAIDDTTVATYGRREQALTLRGISTTDDAQDVADYELARRKTPRGEVPRLGIFIPTPDGSNNLDLLEWTFGTRLTVTLANGHSADHHIIGWTETIEHAGAVPTQNVEYILQPVTQTRLASHGLHYQDTWVTLRGAATTIDKIAIPFVPSKTTTVSRMKLKLKKTGTPVHSYTAEIFSNSSGSPGSRITNGRVSELTDEHTGSLSGGTAFTHEADCRIVYTVDTVPTAPLSQLVEFRIQNATNFWYMSIDGTGSLYLYEDVAGVPTQRGYSATAVSNGNEIQITAADETITLYVNGTQKIQYTSAANFKTETDGLVFRVGTSGAMSNLTTYPYPGNEAALATEGDTVELTFSTAPSVTKGTTYWIVLSTTRWSDASNYIGWGADDEPLLESLVSHWALEEATSATRNDGVGSNHLADSSDVIQEYAPQGYGAGYDGTSKLWIASNATLNMGDEDFELECMIYPAVLGGVRYFIGKWSATAYEYLLYYDDSNACMAFIVSWDGTEVNSTFVLASTYGDLTVDRWYHVRAWHDSVNNLLGIQVNGVQNTQAFSNGCFAGTSDFQVGFVGVSCRIDNVYLWDRLLTTAERTSMLNSKYGQAFAYVKAYDTGTTKVYQSAAWAVAYNACVFEIWE